MPITSFYDDMIDYKEWPIEAPIAARRRPYSTSDSRAQSLQDDAEDIASVSDIPDDPDSYHKRRR